MWAAVIVFAALATCAVVVVTGYFRRNRKTQAARAHTTITLLRPRPEAQPEPDDLPAHSEAWIWR
jgi:hypothetical protein